MASVRSSVNFLTAFFLLVRVVRLVDESHSAEHPLHTVKYGLDIACTVGTAARVARPDV